MNAMSNTQLRGAIADANNSIRAQKEAVADLQSEVDSLRDRYQNFTPAAQKLLNLWGKVQISPANRRRKCLMNWLARREILAAKDKLSRTEETASEATRTLTNNMLTAMGVHDQLIEKSWSLEQVQGAVAKAFGDS
jgi:chromosome segregation ATPase